jgi:hypothetical protein
LTRLTWGYIVGNVSTSQMPGRATRLLQPWPLTGRDDELAAVHRGIVEVPSAWC